MTESHRHARSSRLNLDSSSSSSSSSFIFSPPTITSPDIPFHHPLLITSGLQSKEGQRIASYSPSNTLNSPTVFRSPGLNQVIEESKTARELRRSLSFSSSSSDFSSSSASALSSKIALALASPALRAAHSSVAQSVNIDAEHTLEGVHSRSGVLESLMNINYNEEEVEDTEYHNDNANGTTQVISDKKNINRNNMSQSRLDNSVEIITNMERSKFSRGVVNNEANDEDEDNFTSNSSVESLRAELKATQAVLRTLRSENSELRFAKSPSFATPLKLSSPIPLPPPLPPQPTEEQEHYSEALLAQAEAAKALSLANASSALRRAALIAKSPSMSIERTSSGVNSAVELSLEAIKILADDSSDVGN